MKTKRPKVPRVKLIPIDLQSTLELQWLHAFIHRHHSAPSSVLPSPEDLLNPSYHYFKAVIPGPGRAGTIVGISCYEVRTRHLVETHKTIIEPRFRGCGLGPAVSQAIEKQAFRSGFRKIRTTIYASNLKMLAIKLAQGYTIEGYHPDHEAPGLHEYSLGKLLKST